MFRHSSCASESRIIEIGTGNGEISQTWWGSKHWKFGLKTLPTTGKKIPCRPHMHWVLSSSGGNVQYVAWLVVYAPTLQKSKRVLLHSTDFLWNSIEAYCQAEAWSLSTLTPDLLVDYLMLNYASSLPGWIYRPESTGLKYSIQFQGRGSRPSWQELVLCIFSVYCALQILVKLNWHGKKRGPQQVTLLAMWQWFEADISMFWPCFDCQITQNPKSI